MLRTGSVIVLIGLAPLWAASKLLGVNASVSAEQVSAGSSFELVVAAEVEGDASDLPYPEIQLPTGITAGAKNRSQESRTQISMVNGSFQKSSTTVVRFHLTLNANKPGNYTLGPVTFQGRNLGSGHIVVNGATSTTGGSASNDIRATTIVGKRKVWVGQQVPFTWRLESNLPLQIISFPDIRSTLGQGFYSAAPDSQGQAKVAQGPDGRNFARLDWKGTLFPLRPGKQTLPATQLGWRVIEGGSVDPFEAMMRGEDPFEAMQRTPKVREGNARTEIVPLDIQAIPETGRPTSFQGGVGQFHLQADLQAPAPRVGQSATLVVRLSGNGQPQAFGVPLWTAPTSIEAYPPQDTWKSVWKDGELMTTLERRIVLVPRKSGKIGLDSIRFGWFDPTDAHFHSTSIALSNLDVAEPLASASGQKLSTDTTHGVAPLSGNDRFWILFGKASAALWSLLIASSIGFLVVRLVRSRLSVRSRKTRALNAIRKKLETLMAKSTPSPGKLRQELVGALSVVHGDEAAGWTAREVEERLGFSWPPEAAEDFALLLRDLEAAEFAGLPLGEIHSRVHQILDRLARNIQN